MPYMVAIGFIPIAIQKRGWRKKVPPNLPLRFTSDGGGADISGHRAVKAARRWCEQAGSKHSNYFDFGKHEGDAFWKLNLTRLPMPRSERSEWGLVGSGRPFWFLPESSKVPKDGRRPKMVVSECCKGSHRDDHRQCHLCPQGPKRERHGS